MPREFKEEEEEEGISFVSMLCERVMQMKAVAHRVLARCILSRNSSLLLAGWQGHFQKRQFSLAVFHLVYNRYALEASTFLVFISPICLFLEFPWPICSEGDSRNQCLWKTIFSSVGILDSVPSWHRWERSDTSSDRLWSAVPSCDGLDGSHVRFEPIRGPEQISRPIDCFPLCPKILFMQPALAGRTPQTRPRWYSPAGWRGSME